MKKIIFLLLFTMGAGSIVQAQALKKLKAKAQAAVNSSVDRSADKLVDKTITKPIDKTADTVLDVAGKKVGDIFKKKNKKNKDQDISEKSATPLQDSAATKPVNQN